MNVGSVRPMAKNVPAGYDIGEFPVFAVTVDIVILSVVEGQLLVLLVERKDKPFKKAWALPGGFKRPDETLDDAARRELREETGVDAPRHLSQFGAYGDPKRDPRGNVVTVGYLAVTPEVGTIMAGTDASDARLWPVAQVLDGSVTLAFDHRRILADAVERAAVDLESSDLATAFVGPTFTLSELQRVYEAVWADDLDTANFRRSLVGSPDASYVEPTGVRAESSGRGGRPPELFAAGGSWTEDGSPVKRPRKRSRPRTPDV
jgi:8-oxo-dGTP diphosphatase